MSRRRIDGVVVVSSSRGYLKEDVLALDSAVAPPLPTSLSAVVHRGLAVRTKEPVRQYI